MSIFHLISSLALLCLGVIHLLISGTVFESLTQDMLWFIGSGLAIIYLALMNLQFRALFAKVMYYRLLQLANILLIAFIGSMIVVSPMLPAYIGLALVVGLVFANWRIFLARESVLSAN